VGLLDTERKGLDILLEAMARVRQTDRAFHLDVVGEGGLRPGYEALAGRLGLDPFVTFHGFRPKDEVAALMREADLFVLGSRFENNPCVVIEAMATGLPVVAPDVGGLGELVDHETGRLARPLDPHDLGDKIGAVLDGLDRFDGEAIAARAADRFGHAAVGRALREVYLQAISDTNRASAASA
jgi:glycosyltransferase involved in cell wall biosynthesis